MNWHRDVYGGHILGIINVGYRTRNPGVGSRVGVVPVMPPLPGCACHRSAAVCAPKHRSARAHVYAPETCNVCRRSRYNPKTKRSIFAAFWILLRTYRMPGAWCAFNKRAAYATGDQLLPGREGQEENSGGHRGGCRRIHRPVAGEWSRTQPRFPFVR